MCVVYLPCLQCISFTTVSIQCLQVSQTFYESEILQYNLNCIGVKRNLVIVRPLVFRWPLVVASQLDFLWVCPCIACYLLIIVIAATVEYPVCSV